MTHKGKQGQHIRELEAALAEQIERTEAFASAFRRVRAENRALVGSRSWRLTAPVRVIGRVLRQGPTMIVAARSALATDPGEVYPNLWYDALRAIHRVRARRTPRRRLAVGPTVLRRKYLLWKTVQLLGIDVVGPGDRGSRLAVRFDDATFVSSDYATSAERVLNGDCIDVSKRRVEQASLAVFGYGIALDPTTHLGPMVEKPDRNSVKEGRLVDGPITDPDPERVYQRVLDNEVGPGRFEVLRATVVGRDVPVARRKWHSESDRFGQVHAARFVPPESIFSPLELRRIVRLAGEMGLDLGELDLIRDRADGRLYVIDVNHTPFSPSIGIGAVAGFLAMYRVAQSFERQWGRHLEPHA